MTRGERLAYQRGYAAGRHNRWPDHMPPTPPEPLMRSLVAALEGLRNEVDMICATQDEQDELALQLGPKLDAATEALQSLTAWVMGGEAESFLARH